jgi:hypothetical protein
MVGGFLSSVLGRLEIEIGPSGFSWARRVLLFARRRLVPLEEVGACRIEEGERSRRGRYRTWGTYYGLGPRRTGRPPQEPGQPQHLAIDAGAETLVFGETLSAHEQEWLRDAINGEIARARRA